MKQTDFDRLKAVCEKEGFEIGFKYDESTYTVRLKKDEWEGVEFGKDNTGRVVSFISNPKLLLVKDYDGFYVYKRIYEPSTESAYIEQLKAECFKRFGDIKPFEKFYTEFDDTTFEISNSYEGFYYTKRNDQLRFNGWSIYQQGKWATRVKERVKVEWASTSCDTIKFNYGNSKDVNLVKDGPVLAKLIEEYLNKESE